METSEKDNFLADVFNIFIFLNINNTNTKGARTWTLKDQLWNDADCGGRVLSAHFYSSTIHKKTTQNHK